MDGGPHYIVDDDWGMALPHFLLRQPGTTKKVRRSPTRRFKPARPEGERWANAARWELHLHDELPDIGTGFRRVWVSVGRKWVHIATTTGGRARITTAAWHQLAKHGMRIDL